MILSRNQEINGLRKIISVLMAFVIIFAGSSFVHGHNLNIGSESAILIETETGEILYEKNANIQRPIASTTKIMTYILVMESIGEGKVKLNDKVRISKNAATTGGSSYSLRINDLVTVRELLNSMMIISANDSAVALAEHISGSVEKFCIEMTAKAKALKLESAYFVNPNGMPLANKDQNKMSAKDMAFLSKYAIDKYGDDLLKVTGQKQFKGDYKSYSKKNTNRLLEETSFIDGLKTGYTDLAGYCLVSTAKVQGAKSSRFIAVVLGGKSGNTRFNDSRKIIEYGLKNFEKKIIVEKGQILDYSEALSDEYIPIEFFAKDNVSVVTKKNTDLSINSGSLIGARGFGRGVLNGGEVKAVLEFGDGREKEIILMANRGISIFLGDDPIRFQGSNPFIKDGVIFVPLKQTLESFGLEVEWDQLTRSITGKNDGTILTIYADKKSASLNGKDVELDLPVMMVEEVTMIPIKFIAETLGASFQWYDDIRTVKISQ